VFKRYVFILAVVSAIGGASLEARERWTDQRDAQFGFSASDKAKQLASLASPHGPDKRGIEL
jgi:hypothetical protein